MKRPLGIIALCYTGGIVAGQCLHLPPSGLFLLTFLTLCFSLAQTRLREGLLFVALFFLGWTNLATRTEIISPNDLRAALAGKSSLVSIRGELLATPDERRFERNSEELSRTLAVVEVRELNTNGTWHPASGKLLATTFGALPKQFFGGQKVEVSGVLHPPRPPLAEGLFDYKTFLERQGIFYQLEIESANDWQLLAKNDGSTPASLRIVDWAQRTLSLGLDAVDESLRLIWAMTLGWKPALTDEVSEPFMRSGTMHIFAISGLHIALISGILVALLRVLRVPRAICSLIIIPFIWFYTGITGWQASAIRSTVMMTIIIAGWSLKKPSDLLNSLGAAAFIVLLWDPQQLFQASFQLSFFVVLSIALLMPTFENFRQRLLKHDPFLPDELRPRWQRWLDLPLRFLTVTFATSLAAWLGSLPLVAYYFHLLTPVSLLANMVVVPLSSLALMANLGSLLCAPFFPSLTNIFNHSGWFFMRSMNEASQWFANLPGAYTYFREPTLLEFALYYLIVFGLITGGLFKARTRLPISVSIALLALFWIGDWITERNTWRVTVLPLAGGEAVLVESPSSTEQLLIDCGNTSSSDFITKPFLRARGINHLTGLLLTHGDLRNVGDAANILTEFKVKKIFTSPVRFRSHAYRVLQESLNSRPQLKQEIHRGDQLGIWTVLHPDRTDKFSQADDGSIVLRGEIHGIKILLLSDLGRAGQELLWTRNENLQADIVVAGLPRETEPLNESLLQKISPRLIVITDAEIPATERASSQLRDRLNHHRIPILLCRDSGAITLKFHREKLEVKCRDAAGADQICSLSAIH